MVLIFNLFVYNFITAKYPSLKIDMTCSLLRYQTNYNIVLAVSCKYIRCPCPIVCLSVCVVNMYCIRVQCILLSVSVHLSVCVVCTVSLFVLYFRTPFLFTSVKKTLKQHLSLRSLAKRIHTLRQIGAQRGFIISSTRVFC